VCFRVYRDGKPDSALESEVGTAMTK